jgi:hypothetical protein
MGWQKWYEDHEIDPGLFNISDLLGLLLLPLILVFELVFALILAVAPIFYLLWRWFTRILAPKR